MPLQSEKTETQPTPQEKIKNFAENLPKLKEYYKEALHEDRSNPDRKFVWGELNRINADSMFSNALRYTLEIVHDSLIEGQNEAQQKAVENKAKIVMAKYGPSGTESGKMLQEFGDIFEDMLNKGITKERIELVINTTDLG